MAATIKSIMASLAICLLLVGCSPKTGTGPIVGPSEVASKLSESLLMQNSQLENQITSQHNITTGLSVALIIVACSLGILILEFRKGVLNDKRRQREHPLV